MARVSKHEVCLICGEAPCVCGKPAKAKPPRARRVAAPEPVAEPTPPPPPKPSALNAMKAAAQAAKLEQKRDEPAKSAGPSTDLSESDALFISALRALMPLGIAEEDIAPFRKHLDNPPSVPERSAAWRARRRRGDA